MRSATAGSRFAAMMAVGLLVVRSRPAAEVARHPRWCPRSPRARRTVAPRRAVLLGLVVERIPGRRHPRCHSRRGRRRGAGLPRDRAGLRQPQPRHAGYCLRRRPGRRRRDDSATGRPARRGPRRDPGRLRGLQPGDQRVRQRHDLRRWKPLRPRHADRSRGCRSGLGDPGGQKRRRPTSRPISRPTARKRPSRPATDRPALAGPRQRTAPVTAHESVRHRRASRAKSSQHEHRQRAPQPTDPESEHRHDERQRQRTRPGRSTSPGRGRPCRRHR